MHPPPMPPSGTPARGIARYTLDESGEEGRAYPDGGLPPAPSLSSTLTGRGASMLLSRLVPPVLSSPRPSCPLPSPTTWPEETTCRVQNNGVKDSRRWLLLITAINHGTTRSYLRATCAPPRAPTHSPSLRYDLWSTESYLTTPRKRAPSPSPGPAKPSITKLSRSAGLTVPVVTNEEAVG
jgi:hypothetical protein